MVLSPPSETLSPAEGLTTPEAQERLRQDGPNALPDDEQRHWGRIGRDALREPMFALLLAAALLYLVLGDLREGLALVVMVLLVLALTLYQEGRTELAIAALRNLGSPRALVLRDGQLQHIPGQEVVVGDLLSLAEGDRVAADAWLLSAHALQLDESLLTGESVPVDKHANLAPGHPDGKLYGATLVVHGHGMARVSATGARSEMGRIGGTLRRLKAEPSPLRRQTGRLVQVLALVSLLMGLALMLAHGLMHGDWMAALLAGLALSMALLPQEFTVVLTVIPALGAWRLAREKVLTRRIAAIETLGATSVLCVDKTGTLTENRMEVAQLYAAAAAGQGGRWLTLVDLAGDDLPEDFHALVEYAILASAAEPFDPMEQAFHRLGAQHLASTEHLHEDWRLLREYSLTPELRAMSHVWRASDDEPQVVAAKGSPEAILALCRLPASQHEPIALAVETMAAQGLRVLAVASARFTGTRWPEAQDFEFGFLGLLGLMDPLRAGVVPAMAECREAGIRVVMVTGDYPATARAIASRAGLVSSAHQVLTGDELDRLDEPALQQRMQDVQVCARIAPAQKLRIVQALQRGGAVVAMTGDGVNDAPALKAAHVGVAMGRRGTDVAREAAALVLLDDNFASIVRGVRLGRQIFDNLRKSMSYVLAVHVPIAGMALAPVLLGWPVLLFPLHIAFLELVIDPACSMVFENEPPEPDLMQRPPRSVEAPLLAGLTLGFALLQGLGLLMLVLGAYAWFLQGQASAAARGLAFVTLVTGNLALILSNRTHAVGLVAGLRVRNPRMWVMAALIVAVLALVLYQPALSRLFYFESPQPLALVQAVVWGLCSLVWFEGLKRVRSRLQA